MLNWRMRRTHIKNKLVQGSEGFTFTHHFQLPDCCSINTCSWNTLAVHVLNPKGHFCYWEDWVSVQITWFYDDTCYANVRIFWYKYFPCGFGLMLNHCAQCPICRMGEVFGPRYVFFFTFILFY